MQNFEPFFAQLAGSAAALSAAKIGLYFCAGMAGTPAAAYSGPVDGAP
jgi:hypothetical protein